MRSSRDWLEKGRAALQRELGPTLVALSFVVSALLVTAFLVTVWTGYFDTRARAEREAKGLLEASVGYIDNKLALWTLALDIAARELNGIDVLDNASAGTLAYVAGRVGYVGSLLVLDSEGNIVADPMASQRRTGNFADRDYFRAHVGKSDFGIFISEPFRSRLRHGDPSIALSRRLSRADGSFAGVVMVAVRLTSISSLFGGLQTGPGDVISLISPSGRLLVRKPSLDGRGDTDVDLSESPLFKRMMNEEVGSFTAVATTDGVDRLFSFTQVPGTKLLLSIGLSTSNIFASWWRWVMTLGLLTAIMCGGAIWLAFRLKRELARRTKAERQLSELAITDGLTGLPNRRRFDEMLQREWRRAARTGAPLSVLMLDADHFKELNDTFGHAVGDVVLKCLGEIISGSLRRPGDLGARYGGEEFAVILPDTSAGGAVHIAESILLRFRAKTADLIRPCSVSVGISTLDLREPQSVEQLLACADAALYRAKADGRNCVRVAIPERSVSETL